MSPCEEDGYRIEGVLQRGFVPGEDDDTYVCTEAQLLDVLKIAEQRGHRKAQPHQLVAEIRAGPMRLEAVRVKEGGKITFSMMFDNDLMCFAGEESARMFTNFVSETLNLPLNPNGRELLQQNAMLFRFYEKNHRDKATNWQNKLDASEDGDDPAREPHRDAFAAQINDTFQKAERNRKQAQAIEDYLAA